MDLQQQIVNQINDSLRTVIDSVLTNQWSSPIWEIIKQVVNEQSWDIKAVINDALSKFTKSESFRDMLVEEMNHKLAKSCVSLMESQVDKSLNSIKQDPILKAKMIMALETIINDNSK